MHSQKIAPQSAQELCRRVEGRIEALQRAVTTAQAGEPIDGLRTVIAHFNDLNAAAKEALSAIDSLETSAP